MFIQEAFKKGTEILKSSGNVAPVTEAGVILCYILKRDRSFLYAHGDYILKDEEIEDYFRLIRKRSEHIPLQYITGHQEFMSLDFLVNPHVLIPRQDTEVLVESVISFVRNSACRQSGEQPNPDNTVHISQSVMSYSTDTQKGDGSFSDLDILDLGTGSGCVAVSLAYYIPKCIVTATDISEEALKIARMNAEASGVDNRIHFMSSDLFGGLKGMVFDIIVSNPPYIPTAEIGSLQPEVRLYESAVALDGGEDGLAYYRKIIQGSMHHLKSGGLLALEAGKGQIQDVQRLLTECRFQDISAYQDMNIYKDIQGIDRVVTARKS